MFTRIRKYEEGQALVIAVFLFMVGIAFAALVVDVGYLYAEKQEIQSAVDAAALAGAQELPNKSAAITGAKKYAELNGVETSDAIVTTPYQSDSTKIEVVGTRTVKLFFAPVIGFKESKIQARAVARNSGASLSVFDYAVFSGGPNNPLGITGSGLYVEGSAHSNHDLSISGSGLTITGAAEAVGEIGITGSNHTVGTLQGSSLPKTDRHNVENKISSAAPWINMPDFSEIIKKEAESVGQVYIGDQNFTGTNKSVDSSIYVDGNLRVSGSGFRGRGTVLVTGDISFTGSNHIVEVGDAISFYSLKDISISGSNYTVDGMFYAPNGRIRMTGSNQTINGSVIGNEISFSGSNRTITGNSDNPENASVSSIELTE